MPSMDEHRCAQCNAVDVPLLACDDPEARANLPPGYVGKPRFCNNCMIGKRVRVFWPVDERWYTGTVQQFDPSNGQHLLKYQDGDTEWVKIGENNTNSSEYEEQQERGGNHEQWEAPPPPQPYPSQPPPPGYYPPYGHPGMQYAGGPPMYGNAMIAYGPAPPQHHFSMHPQFYSNGSRQDEGTQSVKRKSGPRAWSKHEDELLLSIVASMQGSPMKWTVVAQSLPERTGKQCRERYVNHLNPRLKTSDWTIVEDATIFHLYNSYGSTWARMSKVIPGRTDNGIKNRFHNIKRQYEREDSHRTRLSSNKDCPEEIRLDRIRKFPKHLAGNNFELWDLEKALGVLAAQSVLGGASNSNTSTRTTSRFGPFRDATDGEMCVRCGFLVPSVQTGRQICTKTSWCTACTNVPPHASSNMLRECLNLRRCSDKELREIVEGWEELIVGEKPEEEEKTSEQVKVEEAVAAM